MVFTTVILIITASGIGYYWFALGHIPHQTLLISEPSPITRRTARIYIQGAIFFKVTIPPDYTLINGNGDYIRYMTDRSGDILMGFYISSGLGEGLPKGQILIDDVPFTIEGEFNSNTGAYCPANLYATNAQFRIDHLYFGIHTWCKNGHDEEVDMYQRVIRSVRFSKELKAVLLGNSPPERLAY